MRFSQRLGFTPASKVIQRESIDQELRNSLWNLLIIYHWNRYSAAQYHAGEVKHSNLYNFIVTIWAHHFKSPLDTIPTYWNDCLKQLRSYFFEANWHQLYDFIEFVADFGGDDRRDAFVRTCNGFLERENSAYRFIDGKLAEITSQEEIAEIETAIANASPFAGVKAHLVTALKLMSDRKNPDYRNSIKESISGVEALARKIEKDDSGTLGSILKKLEKSKKLHPALKSAFSSLYGYSSDADGIRHALLDEPNLPQGDARFMLICCSAFINYVIDATKSV